MDEKQSNKLIGYAILGIIAYQILQALLPFLVVVAAGLILVRAYCESQKWK